MSKIIKSFFTIPNNSVKYCYSFKENDNKRLTREFRSLTRALNCQVLPSLGLNSFEEFYNIYYNGNIGKCNFCNNHLIHANFKLSVNKITNELIMELLPIEKFMCSFKDCKDERRKYNPNSIFFVSKEFNISEEDANKLIIDRNKSPFYYHPEIDSLEEYKNRQKRDKAYYIDKFGLLEGEKRYKERSQKLSISNSKEELQIKYGKDIAEQICKSRAITLDNLVNKYKDINIANEKYNKWLEKLSWSSSKEGMTEHRGKEFTEQHFKDLAFKSSFEGQLFLHGKEYVEKSWKERARKASKEYQENKLRSLGYTEEEIEKHFRKFDTNSLLHFIEKYGEIEGKKKYIEKMEKYYSTRYGYIADRRTGFKIDSFEAFNLFSKLENQLLIETDLDSSEIFYSNGKDKTEYRIDYFENNKLRWFKLDFAIPKFKFNVEFNGEFYHPRKTEDLNFINKWNSIHKDSNAYQKYMERIEKRKQIVNELHGFITIEIFDTDITKFNTIENIISNIVKKFKEYVNENFN